MGFAQRGQHGTSPSGADRLTLLVVVAGRTTATPVGPGDAGDEGRCGVVGALVAGLDWMTTLSCFRM